jgi:hypothetical protein
VGRCTVVAQPTPLAAPRSIGRAPLRMLAAMRFAPLLLTVLAGCTAAAPTPAASPGLEVDLAAERAALLALHQRALRAHLEQDVEMLLADETEDHVLVNRARVTTPSKADRRAFLGPYLRATRFDEYRDSVAPTVRVSADGTLGWVVVQIAARGVQETPSGARPIEFASAWIELYDKRDGRWLRSGIVSTESVLAPAPPPADAP